MPGHETAGNQVKTFVQPKFANESGAGGRHYGPSPARQGTTSFLGTGNPTVESRIAAPKTHRGNVAASRTMAASMQPAFGHAPNQYVPPRHNKEARPPSTTHFYGPSLQKSNVAHPEAPVYGLGGGGSPIYMRGSDNGKTSLTRKV